MPTDEDARGGGQETAMMHVNGEDEDYPIGVPGVPKPAAGVEKSAHVPASVPSSVAKPKPAEADPNVVVDDGGREGDSGLGSPRQVASEIRDLTDDEIAHIEEQEERLARHDAERILEELERKDRGLSIPEWLRGPSSLLVLAAIALLGTLLIGQVSTTLASLGSLPEWAYYPVIAGLAACGLLVIYVAFRFAGLYVRLRRVKQIRVKALQELSRRQSWHTMKLARYKLDAAQAEVRRYLRDYPLAPTDKKNTQRLLDAGLSEEELRQLRESHERLLDPTMDPGAEPWLDEVAGTFQAIIDGAAKRRIKRASREVGILTAAAPYDAFDIGIVSYKSFQLLGDLCILYNLRASNFDTAMILGKVMLNTFVAANMQEVGNQLGNMVAEDLSSSLGKFGAKFVGGTLSRLSEGVVNAMLIRRLGRTTRLLLQPIASK